MALIDCLPGIADDERAEDGADSGAGPGDAHRRSTGPDVLGRRIDIQSTGRSLNEGERKRERGRGRAQKFFFARKPKIISM